jgi:hypothetical protein
MTKAETFLFTFIDGETGERADQLAPNEPAARLWLGDQWMFSDRCPLFAPPASVMRWDLIINDAQAEADKAKAAMMAAQPKPMAAKDEWTAYHAAGADYDRKSARATMLARMSIEAEGA